MSVIEQLKAVKRSVIDGKWRARGMTNGLPFDPKTTPGCLLNHMNYVQGFHCVGTPLWNAVVYRGIDGWSVGHYNDTHTKWDIIAMLGKLIRVLEMEACQKLTFHQDYTQQETNDV